MNATKIAGIAGLGLGAALLAVTGMTLRLSTRPGRSRPWSDPKRELGLDFEDVEFPAQDGTRLVGWYIPPPADARRPAPVIVSLHGWPWCRMGTRARNPLNDLPGSKPVNLMPMAARFYEAGYGVLMFDLRNYGNSEARGVITGGWLESRDVLGALEYLAGREDVDAERIGLVSFSAGGATLLFTLPHTTRIRAAVAVQPAMAKSFFDGYSRERLKWLAGPITTVVGLGYRLAGGPRMADIRPDLAAAGARDVPVLFIQGTGDPWGSMPDVKRMAELTPRGQLLTPETRDRFDGYSWVLSNLDVLVDFFRENSLAPAAEATSVGRPATSVQVPAIAPAPTPA